MSKPYPNSIAEKRPKRVALSEIRPVPRRGLSRDEGAMYIGVSASKFDELIADGRMPKAIRLDGRKLWDIRKLDAAFDALSDETPVADDTWKDFGEHSVKR
jgi:predicted DNA-binding transcriptional regulator AlpA